MKSRRRTYTPNIATHNNKGEEGVCTEDYNISSGTEEDLDAEECNFGLEKKLATEAVGASDEDMDLTNILEAVDSSKVTDPSAHDHKVTKKILKNNANPLELNTNKYLRGIKQCYVKVKKVNSGEKEKKIKRKRLLDEYNDTKENRAKAAATHEFFFEHRVKVKQVIIVSSAANYAILLVRIMDLSIIMCKKGILNFLTTRNPTVVCMLTE